MNNKKIINLVFGLIILGLVGFGAYYFWPKGQVEPTELPLESYFEFRVLNEELVQWEIDKFKTSFEEAKAVLMINDDDMSAWLKLAQAKKNVGDYRGAELAWLKVNEIRPKNSPSFISLYDMYTNFTKEYDKALPMYQKAIENTLGEEKNIEVYRDLYNFYTYQLQDGEKAKQTLFDAAKDNPKSSLPWVLLGRYYEERAFYRDALSAYEKALELDPQNPGIKQAITDLENR